MSIRLKKIPTKILKKLVFFLSAVVVAGIGIFIYSFFFSKPAVAAWFNESWLYRKAITVTVATNASDITDLETLVTVDTSASGKFQSSCQDLRFTNVKGDLLPYYIDSGCGTASTKVWVLVDLVPKNTTTYLMYMYYGNPSAPAASDENKFRLFKDLAGYWTLNETSGNRSDSSINSSTLTDTNTVTSNPGQFSNAGQFTATTTEYLTVNDNASLSVGDEDFTITTWAYLDSLGGNLDRGFVCKGNPEAANTLEYCLRRTSDNTLVFDISDGTTETNLNATTFGALSASTWYFVVAWYDSTANTMNIQINNGAIQSASHTTGSWDSSNAFRIGGDSSGGIREMDGRLDDVRFYKRTLSASEISQLYTNPGNIASNANATTKPSTAAGSEEQSPGPVGYWAFDDGQGTNAQDSSSSGNDGTITGATWQTEDQCVSGKCLYFDGSSSYVSVTNALTNSISIETKGTISFWMNAGSDITTRRALFSAGKTNAATVLSVEILSGVIRAGLAKSGTQEWDFATSAVIKTNTWHYVSLVQDGTSPVLYVDGVNVSQPFDTSTDKTMWFNNLTLDTAGIGVKNFNNQGNTNFFKNKMDDVKIYPYARTAAQVKSDYNAGKANASANSGTGAALGSNPQDWLSNGLVGYWKMDETATPSVDSSGNGNSGTWNGNTAAATGKFGNGTTLDGTGDYIDLGTGSTFAITGDITDVVWIKANSDISKWRMVMGKESPNRYPHRIYINKSDVANPGKVNFDFTINSGTGVTVTSTTAVNDDTWHQVVGVRKGSSAYIYVDGVLENSTTFSGTVDAAAGSNMVIGDTLGCSSPTLCGYSFYGTIDEIRIYNRALTSAEISSLYNWAPGPVRYWNFEEGSGNSAIDVSGNGGNGTWNGTGAHWATGKYGKAGKFNGSDDYVDTGLARNSSSINGDFTASAWVYYKGAAGDGYMPIFATKADNGGGETFFVGKDTGSANIGIEDGTWTANMGLTLASNSWQYITYVKSGTTKYLYVNGILSSTTAATGTLTAATISIGYENQSGGLYFNGLIDEAKLYNYARSAKQVVSDMNANHPNVGSPVGSALGHWKFDEGQGTVANNSGSGGSTYNGTITNATWSQAGKFGKALNFDGNGDKVVVSNASSLVSGSTTTLSLWINPTTISPSNGSFINRRGTSNGSGFSFEFADSNGNVNFSFWNGTENTPQLQLNSVGNLVAANVWTHLLVTYDGSTIKIYINGTLNASGAASGAISSSATNLEIGHNMATDYVNYWYQGKMDEVKIYNYALTSDEVKTEYNKGSSLVLGTAGNNSSYEKGAANQEYCVPGDTTSCAAPVARWDFEEGRDNSCSGGTNDVCDTSGSGNDGAWNGTGTKHWDTGKVGKGGKFNGTDDYVNIDNILNNINTTAGSWSAWIKIPDGTPSSYQRIINMGDTNANGYANLDIGTTGKLEFAFAELDTNKWILKTNSQVVFDNTWVHVAIVQNGVSPVLYVNGVAVAQTFTTDVDRTFWFPQSSIDTARIGDLNWNNNGESLFFTGQIDEVKIYNYARSAAQIAYDYNRGAPVGHWKFDECQGATAYDSSGNKNHGTITIGATDEDTIGTCATSSTAWGSGATGKRNASLSFDGDDDYISIGDKSVLDFNTGGFSASMWLKADAGANGDVPLAKGAGATNNEYFFYMDSNGKIKFGGHNTSNVEQNSGLSSTDIRNAWHLITGIYDGTNFKIYVDGKQENSTASSGTLKTDQGDVEIGRQNTADNYWQGQIDDVRVYNYALTAAQVKDVMNNGAINFAPSTGSP